MNKQERKSFVEMMYETAADMLNDKGASTDAETYVAIQSMAAMSLVAQVSFLVDAVDDLRNELREASEVAQADRKAIIAQGDKHTAAVMGYSASVRKAIEDLFEDN